LLTHFNMLQPPDHHWLAFSVLLQMNCWQRRRGTRTSVMSWIRPSLSWQDTEVPSFLSHLHTSSPLTPLLFICKRKHTVNLSIKQTKKASTNLHYCPFILECVYEAINWPKRQRRYMNSNFFCCLYLSSVCTKRGLYRASEFRASQKLLWVLPGQPQSQSLLCFCRKSHHDQNLK